MKGCKIIFLAAVICLFSSFLYADIYEWTDENGVQHFTNTAPPKNAKILIKTPEVPYDEAADRERMEDDRQRQLELARLEIAEKEAEIERRIAEADRIAAEAERYSEEVRQRADQYLEEARYSRRYFGRYGFWGYYRTPRYYVKPHKRHHHKKKYYGQSGKYIRHKYVPKKHFYHKAYVGKHHLKYRGKHGYRKSHIGSRGKGYFRRGYSRGGRVGMRR